MALSKGKGKETDDDAAKHAAAVMIQRLWRGTHSNSAKTEYLDPASRWDDAATSAKFAIDRNAAIQGKNTPKQRWQRAVFFISQMNDQNAMLSGEGVQVEAEDKHLETQHWLELVDGKHRYGSNLKWYHKRWQEEDTTDNFFKWLDYGGGKDLSLDQCPRETLEKERIIYLSAEQRLNYLVKIDPTSGKLLWAKNNQPVDTSAGDWKDMGDGQGIVPEDLPATGKPGPPKPAGELGGPPGVGVPPATGADGASEPGPSTIADAANAVKPDNLDPSRLEHEQDNAATHYAGLPRVEGRSKWSTMIRRYFTPKGIMERLLRKTVRRNTWIYISDKNFNIFIGIKDTGTFQHSSFISGGLVTSAGLISVKQGVIHTLSPLSGHYRTSTQHFHKFIDVLTERGVDMHKVKISKAEAALWGIEHLAKFKKAQSHALGEVKRKVKSGLGVVTGKWKGGEKKKKEEPQNRPRDSQTQEEKGGGEELAKEKEKGKGKEQVEERKDESQKSQPQPQEEGEEEEEEELTKDSRAGPGPESTEGKSEGKDPLKSEPKAKIAEEPSVSPLPTSPGSPRSDG